MDHAKSMVLVDEEILDNLWHKQDTMWKQPINHSTKHGLSKEMRLELGDVSIPEVVNAKHYQQFLSRFLNTKQKLMDELLIDWNPSPSAINDMIDLNVITDEKKNNSKAKCLATFKASQ
jgi:hypothetical protein